MPSLHEIAYALFGTYRFALFDRTAMGYFDRSPDGAFRSFYAALFVLPAYVVLLILRSGDELADVPLIQFLAVETITYVVMWTAYAVIMIDLCRLLARSDRYFGFLCAYNWASLPQITVMMALLALTKLGLLAGSLAGLLELLVMIGILVYQWFITRTALNLPSGTAVGLVFIDLILAIFISSLADSLLL